MALDVGSLASSIEQTMSPESLSAMSAPLSAQIRAAAISAFWQTGTGPGGSSVIPTVAFPLMLNQFTSTLSAQYPSVDLVAQEIAAAVDIAMLTNILLGGTYGGHIVIVTPGPSGLGSELAGIWQSQFPSPSIVAQKEAQAYLNYTTGCTAFGTGIPPVIPPQIGPIS